MQSPVRRRVVRAVSGGYNAGWYGYMSGGWYLRVESATLVSVFAAGWLGPFPVF